MKLGYRQKQSHSQRGALGSSADESPRSLAELMHQLEGLEARLHQLKVGVSNLLQLQQIPADGAQEDVQHSAQEVIRLQEAADNFELELASRVVSWQHLQEPFWQAVRFGGLGLLLGWALAWFVYAR
ncbi:MULTISPECIES: DUF2203 domain-containing protein [Cyanophyceae]|uniref:DUF2203 domain-containing protein n=1 Tax=Cyanophyceae TaxID=3028117 RepID=UPI001682CE15|nr:MULTISPECIES: DUF2203 domain-containing protein [Cyanophyceae]MBD1918001.1 DUF2203 domain-containing protein [Phormidium sp. FACHB-77]MBD2029249.1 DUF2203 domain-containing protein [Phormidium sp. FACHB-322]MBD2049781.1 DUF2203 domain-containing protein [Leptolyngbya sp. FACHB-60]